MKYEIYKIDDKSVAECLSKHPAKSSNIFLDEVCKIYHLDKKLGDFSDPRLAFTMSFVSINDFLFGINEATKYSYEPKFSFEFSDDKLPNFNDYEIFERKSGNFKVYFNTNHYLCITQNSQIKDENVFKIVILQIYFLIYNELKNELWDTLKSQNTDEILKARDKFLKFKAQSGFLINENRTETFKIYQKIKNFYDIDSKQNEILMLCKEYFEIKNEERKIREFELSKRNQKLLTAITLIITLLSLVSIFNDGFELLNKFQTEQTNVRK